MGAEQTNTSLVLDEHIIIKLFRRVAVGPNPDLELFVEKSFGRMWMARLAASPELSRMLWLDGNSLTLKPAWLRPLATSPHLTSLRRISASSLRKSTPCGKRIAQRPLSGFREQAMCWKKA